MFIIFPVVVQIFHHILSGSMVNITNLPKIHDYLQFFQVSLCSANNSNINSELVKQFFRKFRSFLVPGLQLGKSRISQDKKTILKKCRNFDDISKIHHFTKSPKKCWWRLTPAIKNFWPRQSLHNCISKYNVKIRS